jgi:hypothetical protein
LKSGHQELESPSHGEIDAIWSSDHLADVIELVDEAEFALVNHSRLDKLAIYPGLVARVKVLLKESTRNCNAKIWPVEGWKNPGRVFMSSLKLEGNTTSGAARLADLLAVSISR